MKKLVIILSALVAGNASAATITNSDAEERVVVITSGGVRTERMIAPNTSVEACESGCFMLFPSGDILPLSGTEKITIQNGAGRVSQN